MNGDDVKKNAVHLAAAVHLANACFAFSSEGGEYQHLFSSDFQIPGEVLAGLGLLDIPTTENYPGSFRWAVDGPADFERIVSLNLDSGPPYEDVLVALSFCFVDHNEEQFELLVTAGVFEPKRAEEPNAWGKLVTSPVPTEYGRQLEQRWLSWWDDQSAP